MFLILATYEKSRPSVVRLPVDLEVSLTKEFKSGAI